jgi:signal transduction histidine kinase
MVIVGFIAASVIGGRHVWSTFGSVQSGLPVDVLKLHRDISGRIQVLSNLTGKLGQAQAESSRANLDELIVALDAAFVAKDSLNMGAFVGEYQEFNIIETEISRLMDSVEDLVDGAPPLDTLRARVLHMRLTHIVAQIENSYLVVNEKTLLALTEQSRALGQLRSNTFFLLGLIGAAIGIVLALLMWSNRVNTRLRDARNELARQSGLLQATLDSIDQGFAVWNTEDRLVIWNDRCLDFWQIPQGVSVGTKRADLLNRLDENGFLGDGDNGEPAARQLLRIREMENDSQVQLHLRDGRCVNLRRYPIPDRGTAAVYTDITELKRAEVGLRTAKEQAEQANQAKSGFLSSMSHELRTPLNAILGFGQMLDFNPKEPLSGTQKDCVDHIIKGGQHLLELINDVLDLAKIESGKVELSIENVGVRSVLDECLLLVGSMAEERGIDIVVGDGFETEREIRTDRIRFKQSLLNLMSNAIKYNRENGRIALECHETAGRMFHISVADTGAGIPGDRLAELFEPFTRLGAESSNIEGTGIGLTITKQLVERMGGSIGVDSEVGKGSTFWIEIPVAEGKLIDEAMADRETTDATAKMLPVMVGKILYVEDNPANLQLMELIVGRIEGLSMISAHTAELGIELAKSSDPDLIILDINLPGMDGFAALEKLQDMKETKEIPVIALSANAMPRDIEKGIEAGFRKYLTKPVKVEEVVSAIEGLLEC